jgi:hypothetical protein
MNHQTQVKATSETTINPMFLHNLTKGALKTLTLTNVASHIKNGKITFTHDFDLGIFCDGASCSDDDCPECEWYTKKCVSTYKLDKIALYTINEILTDLELQTNELIPREVLGLDLRFERWKNRLGKPTTTIV